MNNAADRNGRSTRSYDSTGRQRAAQQTRARVVDGAGSCFARVGYAGTTMKAIAAEAGVSVETVNGHGPKRDLLFAAFELAFAEREGDAPLSERDDFREGLAATDPWDALRALISGTTAAFARSHGIWRALVAAADVDSEVAAKLDELIARRRDEFETLIGFLGSLGLPVPTEPGAAADALSLIVSHESYLHLVRQAGWTEDRYREWAADSVVQQLELLRGR